MPQLDWTNQLKNYAKENPLMKSRLDLHNLWNDTFEDTGLSPFPEEIEYANPKKDKGEDLFIHGSNTGEKTTIEVYFKRRPLPISGRFDASKDQVVVSFILRDDKGDTYSLEESSVVDFSAHEYRASGFAYESLQSNKIGRIKYRGYLKRNDEEKLVFVKIRFLCLFYSKLFDHQRHFNARCLANQLKNATGSEESVADLLEDKLEQLCQIKGTFQVEKEEERELFFLGAVGRRFLPTKELPPRKVIKMSGFDIEGTGFSVGLVTQGNFSYLYGYSSKRGENFNVLSCKSLTAESFTQMLTNKEEPFEFTVKLSKKTRLKFEVSPHKGQSRLVKVNGVDGMCFIDERIFDEVERKLEPNPCVDVKAEFANTLVVSLLEDSAKLTELTGGKGSSLAQLKRLSQQQQTNSSSSEPPPSWEVPNAVVVTSIAYAAQTASIEGFTERVAELATDACHGNEVQAKCDLFVQWFASRPLKPAIVDALKEKMDAEFGANWTTSGEVYAVRSSAVGEDSAELSAAGQMVTYLGVGAPLERICRAVVACWASQFTYVPVQYKRGYGQPIASPMAVVVQRMIDCSAAGVLFTANPVDGDERRITVTANYGLGESVVSAAAEPDTFTLEVDIPANSYQVARKVRPTVAGKVLGRKGIVTRLNLEASHADDSLEDGVRIDQLADGLQNQSVDDEDLRRLGEVALQITAHYGSPRDIEWGLVASGQLYIFQARPITNLDAGFTDYELMHETDSPHLSEFEIFSRYHWGEILPGSCTWMGVFFMSTECLFMRQQIKQMGWKEVAYNPYRPLMGVLYNQVMFNMQQDFVQGMFNQYPESGISCALVQAFFGHDITDPDVLETFRLSRNRLKASTGQMMKMLGQSYKLVVKGPKKIPALKQAVIEENRGEMALSIQHDPPSMEKLNFVLKKVLANFDEGQIHSGTLLGSTLKSMLLMKAIGGGDRARTEADHNLLLSHCNDVVSAELPNFLRRIAAALKDQEAFAALSDEEALKVLQDSSESAKEGEAAKLFEEFLRKHGHRGHRETDAYHLTLVMHPTPAVQVIKSIIKSNAGLDRPLSSEEAKSVDVLFEELQTPLTSLRRWVIKRHLLPMCRNAVGYRENTKSILMKHQQQMREALWQIARQMHGQGLIPEANIFFFLKPNEIAAMLSGRTNAMFLWKAKARKRLWPTMDKYRFDEFIKGFRMTHRPTKEERIEVEGDVLLKGTAVTIGAVKGRVCVAETIEEAAQIKEGDILLTYSTDIGWTPYFPLISGIVTEIGGTISHGAVIAREMGIPCLIAVDNVCSRFKTGDIAYLDCKTATIAKVKE